MGKEQARGDEDEDKVVDIERDIERLRKRSESLATELLDRAQPSFNTIRTVVSAMRTGKGTLLKKILSSKTVQRSVGLLLAGAVLGALTQRSRERRRLRKTLAGRLLLAVRND